MPIWAYNTLHNLLLWPERFFSQANSKPLQLILLSDFSLGVPSSGRPLLPVPRVWISCSYNLPSIRLFPYFYTIFPLPLYWPGFPF